MTVRLAPWLVGLAACAGSVGGVEGGDVDRPGGDAAPACTSTADCPFGERCQDGDCVAAPLPPEVGCLDDDDCAPSFACAPSTGTCVAIAEWREPGSEPQPQCAEGETRTCGRKVGRCEYGSQACVGGQWDLCRGGIEPDLSESCNGLDDDCDGAVPADETDGDGDGVRLCQGDCVDTDPLVAPGMPELCDGKNNDCDLDGVDEGTNALCDDGRFCNGAETCSAGACTPALGPDCTGLDGPCTVGSCDEASAGCRATSLTDGTSCDDGLFCTVSTTCDAGLCAGGAARSCAGVANACNDGVCDEAADVCVAEPKPDIPVLPCDDGAFCTTGETCLGGSCQGGVARDCAATGCRDGTCDETADACVGGAPAREGLGCDDGLFCTVSELCQSGTCTGGTARNCTAEVGDACNLGVCDAAAEAADTCGQAPVPNGTGCNDGLFCTAGDTCQAGSCAPGGPRDCSAVANACNAGACSEAGDACVAAPRADGTTCNDALYCTINDSCVAGACTGPPRNCTALADACNLGVCSEPTDACARQPRADGTGCTDNAYCTVNDSCQSGACTPGAPRDCSALADACHDGVCDEAQDLCERVDSGTCTCDPAIDADFDGADECEDCDDTNGGVFPGPSSNERCNGIDDNCDGRVDEIFDGDLDGYSLCAVDPADLDCNDQNPLVHPGAAETCGPSGTGNGVDDNCNGYVDEGCQPCTTTDIDGDGVSDCNGDCDDTNPNETPGAPEVCDGADNDCNTFTVDNCDVSDRCNWPGNSDVCRDDLLCVCVLSQSGACNGNYRCTSYCNSSETGTLGDRCTSSQVCSLDLLASAAVHGCNELPTTPGVKFGGASCSSDNAAGDAECRSGNCEHLFTGPSGNYCLDYCGSDAYCPAANTVCRLMGGQDSRCWPTGRPGVGTSAVGAACTTDGACNHGFCADEDSDGIGTKRCTEPCCSDADCTSGFTCSLRGNQYASGYIHVPTGATACASTANCPTGMVCYTPTGQCAWQLSETSPMCLPDLPAQGNRPAGAACAANTDCASAFCEASLNVCVDVCCSDASCPTGLTCELQVVESTANYLTQSRVCVNLSTEEVLWRR